MDDADTGSRLIAKIGIVLCAAYILADRFWFEPTDGGSVGFVIALAFLAVAALS